MRLRRRPYYLLRPRLWDEPLGMLDLRSMVSRQAGYLYLRVPKAANSTVVAALLEGRPEAGIDPANLADAKGRVTHLGDLGWRDLPALRRFFVFTVVRDPYARTLSAYLDKFAAGGRQLDRFGARIAGFDAGQVSFRGFCRYLAAGGEAENAHWVRQTRITGLADRLDFVGRVESLGPDLARILERIGGDPATTPGRAGPSATGARDRLGEYYDAETRRIVAQVYRADFQAFGYPVDG
jgi:hypothetical protein